MLKVTEGDRTSKYVFAFTEIVDNPKKRAKISIGYLTYDPIEYYMTNDITLTLDKDGKCVKLHDEDFLPEIDWFVKMRNSRQEIKKFLQNRPFDIGPSGLLRMFIPPFIEIKVS